MISSPLFALAVRRLTRADIQNLGAVPTWVDFCCCQCPSSATVLKRKLTLFAIRWSAATNVVSSVTIKNPVHPASAWPGGTIWGS